MIDANSKISDILAIVKVECNFFARFPHKLSPPSDPPTRTLEERDK
jgi:hypothetical protein